MVLNQSHNGRAAGASVEDRLGLNIPYEWWPSAAALKGLEAAGFGWVQIAAPPVEMLADPRHCVRHAAALRRVLEVTSLRVVVHGPTNLKLCTAQHYRAFEGLLEYTDTIGASHLVYHALDFSRRGPDSDQEERSLRRLARTAEACGLTVCLENLCPVYHGRSSVCHDPLSVRDLVARLDSRAYGMLLDVGHANVVSGFMGTETAALVEPVLDAVRLFHVHDNFGARLGGESRPGIDPLQLDLHLAPGDGNVPWEQLRRALGEHAAPLMMEIHPAHRSAPSDLRDAAISALTGRAPDRHGAEAPNQLPPERAVPAAHRAAKAA
jgi:sugar phosphate isomerase/epimerase